MATPYEDLKSSLRSTPKCWLVTGGAGFIGSHIVETLLKLNQRVVSLDNYSNGYEANLESVQENVSTSEFANLQIIRGDLADYEACEEATREAELVLHQGALGSVPRSIDNPLASNRSNVTGMVNLFTAAKDAGIKRG